MTSSVDVVVVSYNSRDCLRACVEPLARLDNISVIVVDNASPDNSLEVIADLPVRTIACEQNRGFSVGCNLGLAAGEAPFVLFLNPDACISGEAVRRLADVLLADPEVGIVGPRTIGADGAMAASMRRYQRVGSVWAEAFFLHRILGWAAWANDHVQLGDVYEHPAYPEWLSGGCMLARRSAMDAVGGFDEGFFLYCEDMDLCARVSAAGFKIRYEPTALVRHAGGRSAPRTGLMAVLAVSRVRYAQQDTGPVSAQLQRLGLAAGALTHAIVNVARPAHRRGHIAALRAILGPEIRSAGEPPTNDLRWNEERDKHALKFAISVIWYCGAALGRILMKLAGRDPKARLVVLYYHGVPECARTHFARQMEALCRGTVVRAAHEGPLPDRGFHVGITFDDGLESVLANAVPELISRGFPATIFVPVAFLGKRPGWESRKVIDDRVMTVEELRSLPDLIELGSHTFSHPHLTTIDAAPLYEEITTSRHELAQLTGGQVSLFAFPYGEHDDRVVSMCRQAGYERVFAIDPRPADPAGRDFVRGRVLVDPSDGPLVFHLKAHGAYRWMSRASAVKRSLGRRRKSR